MEFIKELKHMYNTAGLDFDKAVALWRQASFTPSDVKKQVFYDTSVKLSEEACTELLKQSSYADYLNDKDHELDALVTQKLARLTPNVKKELQRIGSNQYIIPKLAEYAVWKIVSKEENGKEAFFLARIKDTEEPVKKCAAEQAPIDNKAESEVLIDSLEMTNGEINLFPTNCPGKGKVQDLLTGETGEPQCIIKNKQCPHLKDFTLAPLAGDKTLFCDVK